MATPHELTKDGFDVQFQSNYLGHFTFTHPLIPTLINTAKDSNNAVRVVQVSSYGHNFATGIKEGIKFDSIESVNRDFGSPWKRYGQSKLAQVMFTIDLAEELKGKGLVVQALHPATYMDTNMVRSAGGTPRATVDEGAAAVLHAITTTAPSGSYFVGERVGTPHQQAADVNARRQLRALSRKLTGLP